MYCKFYDKQISFTMHESRKGFIPFSLEAVAVYCLMWDYLCEYFMNISQLLYMHADVFIPRIQTVFPRRFLDSKRKFEGFKWLPKRKLLQIINSLLLPRIFNRFLMVFTCLALSVFSTIEDYEKDAVALLFKLEIVVVIWFSIEFALRWVFSVDSFFKM